MNEQHEYVYAIGATSKYNPKLLSPLDRAIREIKGSGRKILGFERSRVSSNWAIKLMKEQGK